MKPTMRRTSFASPTQQRKLKRKPSFQSTISETSSPNKRHSIHKFLPTDIKRDSSIDAIHQALEQAGLGEAADKIANLIELSKKASRTGIQEEFFESCNNFKNERDRIQRAALFIDDARNSREIKVERLTSWAVWIYKLEQSPMCSNFFVFVSLLHMYCGVWSPLLRPQTLGHGDLGIFIQPPPYPESQVYIELTCLLLYTLQLSLTVFHSYGSVFFRIVDKHIVPVYMNITNAFILFLFWMDFLVFVVGKYDAPRYGMLLWIYRFFHDLKPGVPSTVWAILTCVPILDVIFLIMLVLSIFAFYGMTLFKGLYDDPYQNFDGFGPAILSLYILMTGDNIPGVLTPALSPPSGSLDNVYFFILFSVAATFFVLPIP